MNLYDQYGREILEGDLVIPGIQLDVFKIEKIDQVAIAKPGQPPLISVLMMTQRMLQMVASQSRLVAPLVFVARPPKDEGNIKLQ